MRTCFIGLGSNISPRHKYIDSAIDKIKELPSTKIVRVSSLYETEPLGPPQPRYINCVIQIETKLTPRELLVNLQKIENLLGRSRQIKWGERTIDSDILAYNDMIIDEEDLKVPHPLMHKRPFVLKGFCEIAPDFIHPVQKKSIRELFSKTKKDF